MCSTGFSFKFFGVSMTFVSFFKTVFSIFLCVSLSKFFGDHLFLLNLGFGKNSECLVGIVFVVFHP